MSAAAKPTLPDPPTREDMDRLVRVLAPFTRVVRPRFFGLDRIPEQGALLVGNHALYGVLDVPYLLAELWRERGVAVRGTGEHAHYAFPIWREALERIGMVRGTRDNVRALMRENAHILVFPGGAGEVFKDREHRYKLIWKERIGFARLAIEAGYPIVPFAAVGIEDAWRVVADRNTPGLAQISWLTERIAGVHVPPIPVGIGPTPLPRPERLYFWFGEPIGTAGRGGSGADRAAAAALRDEVKAQVESGIRLLRTERDRDPGRRLAVRLRGRRDRPSLADTDPPAWFVRRAFDTWEMHGASAALAWLAPGVRLVDPPDWPDGGEHRGPAAVIARLDGVVAESGGAPVVTAAESVGQAVLLSAELRDRSGVPLPGGEFHFAIVVEHGRIARMRAYPTERQARRAALRMRPAA